MRPAAVDLYSGKDPREVPAYGIAEAAHYLQIPPATLRWWTMGQAYATKHMGRRQGPAVIKLQQRRPPTLTFMNLVEAYVLATMRRVHRVPLPKVRQALRFVEERLAIERPLVRQVFLTNGVDLLVEAYGRLINVTQSGQVEIRRALEASLSRIRTDPQGLAECLFPWSRDPDEPPVVEIDPRRAFGKLVIAGTGIPTEVVADRFRAGDSVAALAEDYGLDASRVEAAIRWEHRALAA